MSKTLSRLVFATAIVAAPFVMLGCGESGEKPAETTPAAPTEATTPAPAPAEGTPPPATTPAPAPAPEPAK